MKELFERLENSEEFKKFKEQYPDSYFCTAFFVIGSAEESKKQLNYVISDKEVMSFDLSGEKITPLKLKTVKSEKQSEIKPYEIKIDPEKAVKNAEHHAGKKFSKAIVVLQKMEGKAMWNITSMEGFSISRFFVSAEDGKVQDLKGFNVKDMMRVEKKNEETGKHEEVPVEKLKETISEKPANSSEEQKPDYVN